MVDMAKFREDVVAALRIGTSVSSVKECLRDKGWRRLGCNADFESMLERSGFEVDEKYVGRGTRHTTVRVREG